MLGKLLKYEIKSTARLFLPLYGALVVMSIINKIFISLNMNSNPWTTHIDASQAFINRLLDIPTVLSMTIYIFLIAAIFVATMIVNIGRFYKNLMSDEGYLMFTLPVTAEENILSKLIVSVMWFVSSTVIVILSIFLMLLSGEFLRELPNGFMSFMSAIRQGFDMNGGWFLILLGICAFFALICTLMQIYACISVGQLFHRHRILASIGVYIGINIALQTISSIGILFIDLVDFNIRIQPRELIQGSLIIGTLISIALSIGYFFVTRYLLTHKLNLE